MEQSSALPQVSDSCSWEFRLARVLAERKAQEGSYLALEKAIEDANPADPRADPNKKGAKRRIDRRKLKSLIEDDSNVVLSIAELRAIDAYLEQYGEGLAYVPIFQKPDLMQTVAACGRVTFLLGSKPASERDRTLRFFSHWDVLAMAEIQRGINASEVGVRLDIQDVMTDGRLPGLVESSGKSGWEGLMDDHGQSLVCLGSSRTSPATEIMLCEMFGRPRNVNPPPDEEQPLPFHFVWGSTLPHVFPSHFHLRSKKLAERDPDAAGLIDEGAASALVTERDVFVDTVHQTHEGDTYGVCVAQRRKGGQVWLIVAGVTGAATYATAKLAKSLATRLHEQKRGRDSAIYWAVVRAGVTKDPALPFANVRSIAEETVASGLHVWERRPD